MLAIIWQKDNDSSKLVQSCKVICHVLLINLGIIGLIVEPSLGKQFKYSSNLFGSMLNIKVSGSSFKEQALVFLNKSSSLIKFLFIYCSSSFSVSLVVSSLVIKFWNSVSFTK